MNKRWILFAAIMLTPYLQASEDQIKMQTTTYGSDTYGKQTVSNIQTNGTVRLNGTQVLGAVCINGSLQAKDATVETLQVNGQVDLQNSIIRKECIINGRLTAQNSLFQGELSISSQKIELNSCEVNSLRVREVKGFNGTQIVDLRKNTKVFGPITVDSGKGEVWISDEIQINAVNGATVIRQ